MALFYKPESGWAADVIPFYWHGQYHLFYLRDYRDPDGHGLGTPWEHLTTTDFVQYVEHPQALARGDPDSQDLWVFTGSVLEAHGTFHIFYTGHNRFYRTRTPRAPEQAIMHATSPDLVHWTKDPANPILFADPARYEPDDWRDPFVFWNAEASEYWMLMAARLRTGPSRRRGCLALATSPDLVTWTIRDPFWAPNQYFTHECPDLFRIGDWWYLVYSTFSETHETHYRMSRDLSGPWLAPANDTLDDRAFYAAKTASSGTRRFAFGWNPTREGESDAGRWHWGGSIVVHEVKQAADGSLLVSLPSEVEAAFTHVRASSPRPVLGDWRQAGGALIGDANDGYAACDLGPMPATCRLTARIERTPGTRALGIILRADAEFETGYEVRYEPGRDRLVFDRWPRPGDQPVMLERPLVLAPDEPLDLRIVVDRTIVEVYANERVALSARAYDHRVGNWGACVYAGRATFADCQLAE